MDNKLTDGKWETVGGPGEDLAICMEGGGDIIAEVINGNVADRNAIAAVPELIGACDYACKMIQKAFDIMEKLSLELRLDVLIGLNNAKLECQEALEKSKG